MIIVRLMGGLGNQMFQYAAGKRLALKHGVEMKLDTVWFEKFGFRSYGLDAFNVSEKIATKAEIRDLKFHSKPWWSLLTKRARREAKENSTSYMKEKSFHFDQNVLKLGDEVYLDGYWQSEKYFMDIAGEIKNLFSLGSPSESALRLLERIDSVESVSLHVRRGDYVHNVKASETHVSLSTDYYMEAVAYLEEILGSMEIFLFSDDLPWVTNNLQVMRKTTFVEGFPAVEDMWLMSRCRHNIIANSSFSWWGSWLNSNVGKTVVAPLDWFRSEKNDTVDLIPSAWLRL